MSRTLNTINIREAMRRLGVRRKDLASTLGVSVSTVDRWLSNKQRKPISPDKMLEIGLVLDLPYRELYIIPSNPRQPVIHIL